VNRIMATAVISAVFSNAAAAKDTEIITPVPTYVACTEKAADDLYAKNREVLSVRLLDAMTTVALAQCSFDVLGLLIVNPQWSSAAIRKETGRVLKGQRKTIRSTIQGRFEFDQLEGL
jgi:hypothetical protein